MTNPTSPPQDETPIPLNAEQIQAVEDWAHDSRLWGSYYVAQANLYTFARVILKYAKASAPVSVETPPMTGIGLIAAERQRQIDVEQWVPAHDDDHPDNELIRAAQCYMWAARQTSIGSVNERMPMDSPLQPYIDMGSPDWRVPRWPWEPAWWKPNDDPVRNLEKAGALIAAEIDRLRRLR